MTPLREQVARAICDAAGYDPDRPMRDLRTGRDYDFAEWSRWEGEAGATIKTIAAFLTAAGEDAAASLLTKELNC
jgi:hypothetical protein